MPRKEKAMPRPARKEESIQIRASAETKAILNRAATIRGQKLSEFMLESARQRAEETILDQRVFFLDAEAHEALLKQLDAPVKPDPALRKRFAKKPAWEE
jgi:uncharacterized protein (DUF1778 family)